jgi:glycosyltransferase involved in cell wall biosynthesis
MYSGIFSELYDFDTLLESAKFLSKNEKILFVIRGGGELRDYIIRKIEKMKLKNVVVLGRLDSPYELINILNCADIFIVPMKKNIPIWSDIAIPSKIYEFLSCGKPVICCARGATQELIKNTKAGIIIRTGNSQLLSEAILKLFFDRVLRSQLGENARKSALKEFEISKVINRIELILKSLGKGS